MFSTGSSDVSLIGGHIGPVLAKGTASMPAKCLCLWLALASAAYSDTQATKDGLNWETNLETAKRVARESNRLVLIHFGGPWCQPCLQLEKQVFSQPGFGRELHAMYVAVKVDPRENADLTTKYAVRAVPTDVVITPRGQLICKVESPTTAAAYVETMNKIAASAQPLGETAGAPATAAPAMAVTTKEKTRTTANDSTDDRYADYYRSRRPAGSGVLDTDQPRARPNSTAGQEQPHTTAVSMRQQSAASATAADVRPSVTTPQPHVIAPAAKSHSNPPLALDGFCAVTLIEKRVWQLGDKKWGARHLGRIYLFANEEAQKKFLAHPDRYSPVLSGNDPVMRLDHNQDVAGIREHGAFYNDHIYLFVSEETYHRFESNPERYTVDTRQALRR
jgi:YHS domain-containing protein/thioredoxin-related protein